jgi:signal transduction histidine kinase
MWVMVGARSPAGGRRRRARELLANPVVQFTLAGLAAVVVVGIAAALLLVRAGTDEAITRAKQVSSLAGRGIVEPVVTDGLVAGDPKAIAAVDQVVRKHVVGYEGIVRVKIWDRDAVVVYSDEARLIGEGFDLDQSEREILEGGGIDAETTDLSEPENRYEDRSTDLLEVYLPIQTPSGEPLLFETYIESSFVSSAGRSIWSSLAPVLIGALLVLTALQLPLALSLARRLRRGQREQEELLLRAIDASELERRRIARDLHDGVVQDLAGVSYSVAAAANRADGETRAGLEDAASRLRQGLRDLRGMLVELYPPDLHRAGLRAALSDVVAGLSSRGLSATLEIPDDLTLSERVETLYFRVAQEALRNVVAHSQASAVVVRAGADAERSWLEVEDDGRGFKPGDGRERSGHFGLRMLRDLAEEAGGELEIDSAPGRGTRLRVEVAA